MASIASPIALPVVDGSSSSTSSTLDTSFIGLLSFFTSLQGEELLSFEILINGLHPTQIKRHGNDL